MTTLAYDIKTWMQNLDRPDLYLAVHLSGKVRAVAAQVLLPHRAITFEAWPAHLNTPMGLLATGDMLQFTTDSGEYLGLALGFGRVAATLEHVSFVTPMAFQDAIWRKMLGTISLVPSHAIVGAVPYFEHGDGYCALLIAGA